MQSPELGVHLSLQCGSLKGHLKEYTTLKNHLLSYLPSSFHPHVPRP